MGSRYLVIILGAKDYPLARFPSDQAFERARDRFKRYTASALGVLFSDKPGPPYTADGLDLFNSDLSADDQDAAISQFLGTRIKEANARKEEVTLLLYYVGHGAFYGRDYYFAIRRTRDENPLISSLIGKTLAETIKRKAIWIKVYGFLDSCFSAEAAKLFQSGDEQATLPFVQRGISLLCSVPSEVVSYILPDHTETAYTDGLITALETGSPDAGRYLTLRQVGDLTWSQIKRRREELEGAGLERHRGTSTSPPARKCTRPVKTRAIWRTLPCSPTPPHSARKLGGGTRCLCRRASRRHSREVAAFRFCTDRGQAAPNELARARRTDDRSAARPPKRVPSYRRG